MTDTFSAISNRRIQGLINRLGPDEIRGIARTFLITVREVRSLLEEIKLRREAASRPVMYARVHTETGQVFHVGATPDDATSRDPHDVPIDKLDTVPLVVAMEVKDQ